MKYVFQDIENIKKNIKAKGFVLFLDFDLTLSPLVKNPAEATFPKNTKNLLRKLLKYTQIVIVSGRALQDVKKRVNIPGIIYVGNHGLEYEVNGVVKSVSVQTLSRKGLEETKKKFLKLKRKHNGVLVEDKKFTLALHYRLISSKNQPLLLTDIKKINLGLKKYNLHGVLYKKTFEVRPDIEKDKGTISLFIFKKLRSQRKIIYIGDGKTDEDAFRLLSHGVTIKVGKSKRSIAKYYVRNTTEVRKFLQWLLSLM